MGMLANRNTTARPSTTNRSKVTNGTRLLVGVDNRSEAGRRYRDLCHAFAVELGAPGMAGLTEAEKAVVRLAAALTARSERAQAAVINEAPIDNEAWMRLANSQARALAALEMLSRRKSRAAAAQCDSAMPLWHSLDP
jgi:hypothetical protein